MYTIDWLKNEFEGKEVYTCSSIGGQINLNPRTISFCHGFSVKDQIIKDVIDNTFNGEVYIKCVIDKIKENQNENSICRKCPRLKKEKFHFSQISFFTICTSEWCSAKCIYCSGHTSREESVYNPLPYITELINTGLISPNCLFDWGGGEPTMNRYFNEVFLFLNDHRYKQRINTNAHCFFDLSSINANLKLHSIRTSIDAGTRDTYLKMKGVDMHEEVWNNLHKYRMTGNEVIVKYVLCNYNSDKSDIDSFIERCVNNNIETIGIEAEFNSYATLNNIGPFYFTENELHMAQYFERKALEAGLYVMIGPRLGGERSKEDRLVPEYIQDNIDRNIITNNILFDTFASIESMVEYLKDKKLIIYGTGTFAQKALSVVKRYHMIIQCICDNDVEKHGNVFEGLKIYSLENALEVYGNCELIIASVYYKDIMKRINDSNFIQLRGKIHYIPKKKYDD